RGVSLGDGGLRKFWEAETGKKLAEEFVPDSNDNHLASSVTGRVIALDSGNEAQIRTLDPSRVDQVAKRWVFPVTGETPVEPMPKLPNLNLLRNWKTIRGDWKIVDGRIVGSGDSRIEFKRRLPCDMTLRFRMKVVGETNPRVRFETFHFGYEGRQRKLFLHGPKATGEPFSFEQDREYLVEVQIAKAGTQASLRIDGKEVAASNPASIDERRLWIEAGGKQSKGSVEFFDLEVLPPGNEQARVDQTLGQSPEDKFSGTPATRRPRRTRQQATSDTQPAIGQREPEQNDSASEVRDVIPLLLSNDDDEALDAIRMLEEQPQHAAAAVPTLIQLLERERTRGKAAEVLGLIGPPALTALPDLQRHFPNGDDSMEIAEALGQLGDAAFLQQQSRNRGNTLRAAAVHGLGFLREKPEAIVNILVSASRDRDSSVQRAAVASLARVSPPTEKTLRALSAVLQNENAWVRVALSTAILTLSPFPEEPGLKIARSAMHDADESVRRNMVHAIAECGASTPGKLDLLLEAAQDPVDDVREAASYALGNLVEYSDGELLNLVMQKAQDRTQPELVRLAALQVVFWKREEIESSPAHEMLSAMTEPAESISVRAFAAHCRNELDETYTRDLDVLQRAVKEGVTLDVRRYSVIALGRSGDPDVLPTLITALEADDGTLTSLIAASLSDLREDAAPAVPALCRVVSDPKSDYPASVAARALRNIGQRTDLSIPVLLDALGDPARYSLRLAAVESLVVLVNSAPSDTDRVVAALTALLNESDAGNVGNEELTCAALIGLSKLNDHARSASPFVRALLNADSEAVRQAAQSTLKALE
ncbi:MAG: HEAT repeat domain-containing protein, partial [Planctomycetaceae bacterium]|nr:HEAT repeat domain-containing protein [Planctomycetaceae bacterium]